MVCIIQNEWPVPLLIVIIHFLLCPAAVASAASWTGWAVTSLTSKFYKAPSTTATPTPVVAPSPTTTSASDSAVKAAGVRGEEGDGGRRREELVAKKETKGKVAQSEDWGDDSWEVRIMSTTSNVLRICIHAHSIFTAFHWHVSCRISLSLPQRRR